MKKILLVVALIAAVATTAVAQQTNGFGGQVEVGYGLKMKDKLNVFQVSLMPGYHFGPYLFAGVGVGFNSYSNNGSISTFPVFAHATANFTAESTWTPFVALKVGYGLGSKSESISGLTSKVDAGFYFAPSLGMKYKVSEAGSLSLAVFYDAMAFKTTISGPVNLTETTTNNSIGLRLGYEF